MGFADPPLSKLPHRKAVGPQNPHSHGIAVATRNVLNAEREAASPAAARILEPVLRYGVEVKARHGERIFSQGEEASTIFYVRRGLVVSHAESRSGRGLIVLHASSGEFVPLSALLDGGVYASNGIAQKTTHLLKFDSATLRKLVARDSLLSSYFLTCALKRLVDRTEQLKDLALMDASARVAKLLLQFRDSYSPNATDLSGFEISDRMIGLSASGMSRETVNRKLRSFIEKGLIERRGKKVRLLDVAKLRVISEGGDFDRPSGQEG